MVVFAPSIYEKGCDKKDDVVSDNHNKIDKIQGLRAISIIAVLLFHIRKDIFVTGYLGVDVFFVISGYLMCMLLSKHEKLGLEQISNFYFRRIKRIVAIYLFTIFVFQLSAILWWLSPLDYNTFYIKSIGPIFFVSNLNNPSNYFDLTSSFYKFYLHLWSLAVEIQFYLIVPFLMLVLSFVHINVRILTVALIASISFWIQFNLTGNKEHMSLHGRIWQFMFGFIAFYINQIKEKSGKGTRGTVLFYASLVTFLAFLSIPLIESKAITRLILLSSTVIILIGSDSNQFLCNELLTQLGDISYSIYILHWLIFEWHRYYDIDVYLYDQQANISTASVLILTSITLGYLVEKSYLRLSAYIKDWKTLLMTISVLYLMLFASMRYIKLNAMTEQNFMDADLQMQLKNDSHIENKLLEIAYNLDTNEVWSIDKMLGYNRVFRNFSWNLRECVNFDRASIPTRYHLSSIEFDATCQLEGNGTKNILLLGSSIARTMLYGVEQQFRPLYKHLSVLFIHGCVPNRMLERIYKRGEYESCVKFISNLEDILRQWNYPIDIIIIGFAYRKELDTPVIIENLDQDIDYKGLQSMFASLASIAREVILLPIGHLESGLSPFADIWQRQILNNEDLNKFRSPLWYQKTICPNTKQRLWLIECPKCIFIDLEKEFCNEETGLCDTFDAKRKLAYFMDDFHHNALGSLKVGQRVRELYDEWVEKQKN